jgi:hypothetical protein
MTRWAESTQAIDAAAVARAAAEAAAGDSLDNLLAQLERAGRALVAYHAAYATALAGGGGLRRVGTQGVPAEPPLTLAQAAAALGVSRSKVIDLQRRGRLGRVESLRPMNRIPRGDIAALIAEEQRSGVRRMG